ncbi:MAG: aminotransferase class IV [Dehalococcoidales bacterium]|nr:aminotransferase class IV [Dehalococcoidales bacterium]
MQELVYFNGRFLSPEEARIAVTDYGFLFGYGLFETLRGYRGKLFRLKEHLDRLGKGAKELEIPVINAELENAVQQTLKLSKLADARVRLTVTMGKGSPVPDPQTCSVPTVLVTVVPFAPPAEEVYQKGYRAVTSAIRRYSGSRLCGLKTACYLENIMARQQARREGADEAILLNEKGEVAEASGSNLFLVSRGILKTPGPQSGILPGITRQAVLELAPGTGITAVEDTLQPEDLSAADEAFLTNSLIEIMPLRTIDGQQIGRDIPGPVTQQLMAAYRRLVEQETG